MRRVTGALRQRFKQGLAKWVQVVKVKGLIVQIGREGLIKGSDRATVGVTSSNEVDIKIGQITTKMDVKEVLIKIGIRECDSEINQSSTDEFIQESLPTSNSFTRTFLLKIESRFFHF